jgi:hypothetical protein
MRNIMRILSVLTAIAVLGGASPSAQEERPVPKNSVRVSVPGCAHGYLFVAGRRTQEEAGSLAVPEGMRLRMNGPKKLMADIKAHEGAMIEITGTMKKGQFKPDGVGLGGGIRIGPSGGPGSATLPPSAITSQIMIDVEGWRPIAGENCR